MLVFIGLGWREMTILAVILGVLCIVLPIVALVDILRSRFVDSTNKLIWVIVVLSLNILGAVLYYAIGRKQRVV